MEHHLKRGKRDRAVVGGKDDLLQFVMESPGDVIFLNDITVRSSSTGTFNRTRQQELLGDSFIITIFAAL